MCGRNELVHDTVQKQEFLSGSSEPGLNIADVLVSLCCL
jgi:hypothetical protein